MNGINEYCASMIHFIVKCSVFYLNNTLIKLFRIAIELSLILNYTNKRN